MKTLLLILAAIVICFAAYAATDARNGVWTAEVEGETVHLSMFRSRDHGERWGGAQYGVDVALSAVSGLTSSQANASASDVQFTLNRPAGTISFDGRFSSGNGAGHYRFTPNEAFTKEMATLGYTGFDDNKLLLFAAEDFAPQTVRDLRAIGYGPTPRELDEVAVFRITAAVVKEYTRLGYRDLTFRELVDFRVGRVDAAYISGMRELGIAPTAARELSNMAILGVTPAYVREMRSSGLGELTPRQLTDLRIGHVNAERIAEYKKLGFNLTASELRDFGIHRVTVTYITELRALGYRDLSPRDLIQMRIFNVTPDYIRQMEKAGYHGVPVDKLIKLRMSGADKMLGK